MPVQQLKRRRRVNLTGEGIAAPVIGALLLTVIPNMMRGQLSHHRPGVAVGELGWR